MLHWMQRGALWRDGKPVERQFLFFAFAICAPW
jgi:hypothetical protein